MGTPIVWTSWAHYFGGYQDRLLSLCHTAPDGVGRKDYIGGVLE
jgi:hypothetical protein